MNIRGDTVIRRLVDVVVASTLVVLFAPALLALAIAVRLETPGPVLYRAVRVGRGGRHFAMLKFRSMIDHADQLGAAVSGRHDPRVTGVGRVLRATKLDELPQLFNVVAGTMTLIGPRAESPHYLAWYTPRELELLRVRPGMTGPGQLEFTRRQAEQLDGVEDPDAYYRDHQLHDKLALDLAYLAARDLRRDVTAVAETLGLPLRLLVGGLVRGRAADRARAAAAADHAGNAECRG